MECVCRRVIQSGNREFIPGNGTHGKIVRFFMKNVHSGRSNGLSFICSVYVISFNEPRTSTFTSKSLWKRWRNEPVKNEGRKSPLNEISRVLRELRYFLSRNYESRVVALLPQPLNKSEWRKCRLPEEVPVNFQRRAVPRLRDAQNWPIIREDCVAKRIWKGSTIYLTSTRTCFQVSFSLKRYWRTIYFRHIESTTTPVV